VVFERAIRFIRAISDRELMLQSPVNTMGDSRLLTVG